MEWAVLVALPDDERRRVLASARRRRYARGEAVVREGDRADALHLVAHGRLAVQVSNSAGDAAILNVLGAGSYFGELALMPGAAEERTATVLALEPTETLALSASAFAGLRQRHPGVERLLTVLLARRVEELSGRLVEAMYEGLDQRVVRRLVELCGAYADGRRPGEPVTVPLTQSDLAQLVGGARPSVNQVLRRLEERGVVALRRGAVEVVDLPSLARLAGR